MTSPPPAPPAISVVCSLASPRSPNPAPYLSPTHVLRTSFLPGTHPCPLCPSHPCPAFQAPHPALPQPPMPSLPQPANAHLRAARADLLQAVQALPHQCRRHRHHPAWVCGLEHGHLGAHGSSNQLQAGRQAQQAGVNNGHLGAPCGSNQLQAGKAGWQAHSRTEQTQGRIMLPGMLAPGCPPWDARTCMPPGVPVPARNKGWAASAAPMRSSAVPRAATSEAWAGCCSAGAQAS